MPKRTNGGAWFLLARSFTAEQGGLLTYHHMTQQIKTYTGCMRWSYRLGMYFILLLCLGACSQDADSLGEGEKFTKEQRYQLNAALKNTPPAKRTFVDVTINRTVTLPATDDVILFNPVAVWYLEDGNVYIWDAGDFRIKGFTPEGELAATFGDGRGEGPGQFTVSKNIGVQGDSLFLLDPQIRRLSWFHKNGSLGRTEQFEERIHDYAVGPDGTEYKLNLGAQVQNAYAVITSASGQTTRPQNLQSRDVSSMVFDGVTQSTQGQGIYVPYYYPVLLAFAPGDSMARAYPTPDYGTAALPEPRIAGEGFSRVVSPPEPQTQLHWGSQIRGETLAVQIRPTERDTSLFDIYDAISLVYRHTARIPIEIRRSARLVYEDGLLITRADTTVAIHHLARE